MFLVYLILILIFAGLVSTFSIQNFRMVELKFLMFLVNTHLTTVIFCSFLLGVVCGVLAALPLRRAKPQVEVKYPEKPSAETPPAEKEPSAPSTGPPEKPPTESQPEETVDNGI